MTMLTSGSLALRWLCHSRFAAVVGIVFTCVAAISLYSQEDGVSLTDGAATVSLAAQQLITEAGRMNRAEEIASFGHWVFNLETGMVETSQGARKIYGITEDPLTIEFVQSIPLSQYRQPLTNRLTALVENGRPYDIHFRIRRANDGAIRWIHSVAEYDPEQNIVFGIIRDYTSEALSRQALRQRSGMLWSLAAAAGLCLLLIIAVLIRAVKQRTKAEQLVRGMVTEKDTLLREVHHRIKNNMLTIVNLLSLQADSLENQQAVIALQDAQNRVQSMMVIYEKLFNSTDYGSISIQEYLNSLASEISDTFPNEHHISIETDVEDFMVSARLLFHLGIMVNEILTNSMKYAFPGSHKGVISIQSWKINSNSAILVIGDNGIGIPNQQQGGFGLELISLLAEQINASIKRTNHAGTNYTVYFNPYEIT